MFKLFFCFLIYRLTFALEIIVAGINHNSAPDRKPRFNTPSFAQITKIDSGKATMANLTYKSLSKNI